MGGSSAAYVNSARKTIEVANREGIALELKGYDWVKHDKAVITQEDEDRVTRAIEPYIQGRTKAELFAVALREGILLAPANSTKDLVESPQLGARDYWVSVEHPELDDTILYPGAPVKPSGAPMRIRRRAPLIGEHNQEIYCGELGLSKADLVLLKSAEVI
jgi:crotonobetainyl-CoA:carnitine CoA-transferase CaiB-like acyl-CoA transferase